MSGPVGFFCTRVESIGSCRSGTLGRDYKGLVLVVIRLAMVFSSQQIQLHYGFPPLKTVLEEAPASAADQNLGSLHHNGRINLRQVIRRLRMHKAVESFELPGRVEWCLQAHQPVLAV